ncbi:helix-turn-helix domain-containing protein [Paraburkholderia sp. EG286B]|uniref:helix-turn-helix domain-containing protein n=1 Tax=unclassified Paraburkholderia TaxID=2615204 RepID=UPI0034D2FC1C
MPLTFGSRLAEERDRLGFTQGNIAEWTGINRKTQSAYEKEQRYPDAGYLMTLIEHGVDVAYLLTGKRAARYGAVDEQLLQKVFATIEASISDTGIPVDVEKKAKLFALVYQASSETGQVDPLIVRKAISLIS